MTAKKVKLSPHAKNDRLDRLVEIATKVGWGDELLTAYDPRRENEGVSVLTTTGVLIAKNPKTGIVITAYVANIKQVANIYHLNGYERIPPQMEKIVRKNAKIKFEF